MFTKISTLLIIGISLFATVSANEEKWFMVDEGLKEFFNATENGTFKLYQGLLLGSCVLSTLIAFVALGLAWWTTAMVYLDCQQVLMLCNEKVVTAEASMAKRAINEKMFERLSREANFDLTKKVAEIKQQIKKLTNNLSSKSEKKGRKKKSA